MKILKVIHGYPPIYNAGSENYTRTIIQELKQEHQIIVFTREENDYELDFNIRTEIKDEIKFYILNMPRKKEIYKHEKVDKLFKEILILEKPNICHIGHLNHLSIGIIDELEKLKIPIVFTLHDFWLLCPRGQFLQRNSDGINLYKNCDFQEDEKCARNCYSIYNNSNDADIEYWKNWIHNRMKSINEIIQKIDYFISPSKYLKDRFLNDFSIKEDKIIQLSYGFKIPKSIPQKNKNQIYTFGYIGTHTPAKGINLLIDAHNQIHLDSKLIIFGRNISQSTNSFKARLSKTNIEFYGEYQNETIYEEVFKKIDCIIVPSIWMENSPLVIHEAEIYKIPVITADVGGMSELIQDKINGLLFIHRDVNSLKEKMEYAILNPMKMNSFGNRGYIFDKNGKVPEIKEHVSKLIDIYKKCL